MEVGGNAGKRNVQQGRSNPTKVGRVVERSWSSSGVLSAVEILREFWSSSPSVPGCRESGTVCDPAKEHVH